VAGQSRRISTRTASAHDFERNRRRSDAAAAVRASVLLDVDHGRAIRPLFMDSVCNRGNAEYYRTLIDSCTRLAQAGPVAHHAAFDAVTNRLF
jgi:hypothetical protein